ncbi:hypothetical protein CDV50_03315 [Haematobacter massiliensis]|uniref:hypothetical protein n=1 Tax=Haematobacter massiliensis TaxID=195105 RepID=UPI000B4A1593|nr:hypothetical protein [Haematobacter massiliensis]OWJ73323.1 hypothetical protein CDV50_03315 [Haematobacter massiliensis]
MEDHGDKRGLKSKTIKSVLRNKVNAWLESITDEGLRDRCQKEAIVTGGSIASMLLGEDVNDFDIYFRTKATVRAVADYYVAQFAEQRKAQGGVAVPIFVEELKDSQGKDRVRIVVKSAGVAGSGQERDYEYFEASQNDHDAGDYVSEAFDPLSDVKDIADDVRPALEGEGQKYTAAFLSTNAISLRGKMQLILRFYGEPDEIHASYDFIHCMNYWESGTSSLTLRAEALEALLSRTLVYAGSQYPLCSVIRSRKFIKRGWRINAGQYLKMAMQISRLDLTDHVTLEEQLTGVDVAYFAEVIAKIKERDPSKVDSAYLTEIIDRMF